MATAATAARPMPVGAQDFNDILEEKIVFPNAEGKNQEITFHEAVLSANAVAEALQKRVISRIDHFSISDKTQIAAEYRALKDQYDSLEGLAYRTQEVADAFKSMLPNMMQNWISQMQRIKRFIIKPKPKVLLNSLVRLYHYLNHVI